MPFGLFGTVWSYLKLKEISARQYASIDWAGNLTFAAGLILIMIGVTYGIRPYERASDGLGEPVRAQRAWCRRVAACACSSSSRRACAEPMFRLDLFRIRAFTFGVLSSFLSAVARGGLMFMLIIWLQGIWLPEHGYSFTVDAAVGRASSCSR